MLKHSWTLLFLLRLRKWVCFVKPETNKRTNHETSVHWNVARCEIFKGAKSSVMFMFYVWWLIRYFAFLTGFLKKVWEYWPFHEGVTNNDTCLCVWISMGAMWFVSVLLNTWRMEMKQHCVLKCWIYVRVFPDRRRVSEKWKEIVSGLRFVFFLS